MGALGVLPGTSRSPSKPVAPFRCRFIGIATGLWAPALGSPCTATSPTDPPVVPDVGLGSPAIAKRPVHLSPLLPLPDHLRLVEGLPAASQPQLDLHPSSLKV